MGQWPSIGQVWIEESAIVSEDTGSTRGDPSCEAYLRGLVDTAARQRLPELFRGEHPDALYHLPDRSGIAAIVLRTTSLSEDQLIRLLRYRLGQYVHPGVNLINRRLVYEARLEHEPLSNVAPDDVHVIAGSAATGEILCYAVLKTLGEAPPGTTLRIWERPLFPVEKIHGWGIYNRLQILPDLPVARMRELRHLVKNQRFHAFDELGARAPVEVCLALYRALAGPLRAEIDAVIGDLDERVAKQTLAFFHVPTVLIRGTVPYAPPGSYYFPRYQYGTLYPFAALASDITAAARERLDRIEQALSIAGKQGLAVLSALKRDLHAPKSGLEPPGGLARLTAAELPQRGVEMETRRQMLDMAERLRTIDLFAALSDAEARVLGTLMRHERVAAGEVIIRQGETGDDLYLIESGQAEVRRPNHAGQPLAVAILEAGDHFGEIAMISGGSRTADVVALTPMTLMRLRKDDYVRYLAQLAEIEQNVNRVAAARASRTLPESE